MAQIPSFRTQLARFSSELATEISKHYQEKVLRYALCEIVSQNRAKTGANHYIVGGSAFFDSGAIAEVSQVRFKGSAAKLSDELLPKHLEWAAEYNQFKEEKDKVSQVLKSILARANNWNDVRDMLPDYVINVSDWTPVKNVQRTRPDLFIIPGSENFSEDFEERSRYWNPILITMYGKIGKTISLYLGYRLL